MSAGADLAPLFASDEIVAVRITAALTSIARKRDTENDVDAVLEYQDENGKTIALNMGLRARGNFRNRPDICRFPPLRIDLEKTELPGTLFAGQNKLKLVTHCGNGKRYEEAVIREYLAYRIFNLISDISFRVRLLRVTYVDTGRKNSESTHFGFLIEHKKSLAQRSGVPVASIRKIEVADLDPEYTNITSLFHYFLSNTDFSQIRPEPDSNCCHNHALFAAAGENFISVPYDFDMAGFVMAPQSVPRGSARNAKARQRRYRGWCRFNAHLPASIARFRSNRAAIVAMIRNEDRQRAGEARSLLRFIDKFYTAVESPERIEKKLIKDCKKAPGDKTT